MAKSFTLFAFKAFSAATLWPAVNAQATNLTDAVAAPFFSVSQVSNYPKAGLERRAEHLNAIKQRPDLDPIALNVTLRNDSLISPGYIFLAPYQVKDAGPYIFDNRGVCHLRFG